jgi:transcriptional regulator with XRE-family HTH domain
MASDRGFDLISVLDLGRHLHAKRRAEGRSLRDVAEAMDYRLTPSALSRIEHGAVPDPSNVPALAEWLGVPLSQIGWPGEADRTEQDRGARDLVEVHLRADPRLAPETADALAHMFRVLYDAAVSGQLEAPSGRNRRRRRA